MSALTSPQPCLSQSSPAFTPTPELLRFAAERSNVTLRPVHNLFRLPISWWAAILAALWWQSQAALTITCILRGKVPVLTGASAGGMTSAITALHAFHGLAHVQPGEKPPVSSANRLYSSWVKDVSIQGLLATTDLDNGRDSNGVQAALCCDILDKIVVDAFNLTPGPPVPRSWIGRGDERRLKVMVMRRNWTSSLPAD
jgi:hypothetical protein